MKRYYVHKDIDIQGQHEVHSEDCAWLPNDRLYLGYFTDGKDAVKKAKEIYSNSDGCFYCCKEAHTS